MRELFGLLLGLGYILLLLGISAAMQKRISAEASRKVVHIGASFWWLIAMAFFSSVGSAIVLPVLFVIVNGLSYRFGWFSSIQREGQKQTPGAVYYAVSLSFLTLLSFSPYGAPYIGALGVFAMGLGDGFAAILGEQYGKRQYTKGRSYVGSATLFGVTFLSSFTILTLFSAKSPVLAALVLAGTATVVEAISPFGLDNLTVPLILPLLYQVVFLGDMMWRNTLLGLVFSLIMVVFSIHKNLLTEGGAIAALIMGTLFFAFGGWQYWTLLILFFTSSNAISKIRDRKKKTVKHKEGPRKLFQVLANSLPALAAGTAWYFTGQKLFLTIGLGAIAASTADTWASEIGVMSKKDPVSILTLKPMQRGISGGVSPLGLFASFCGAALIAVLSLVFYPGLNVIDLLFILGCGFFGSVVDSIMGILLQAKYQYPGQTRLSEQNTFGGKVLVSGFAWVSNDWVNLLTGITVVLLALPIALAAL